MPLPASRSGLALLVALALAGFAHFRALDPVGAVPAQGRSGTLVTKNAAGRSGAYYVPAAAPGRALPLLMAFHGTGYAGADMVRALTGLAEHHGFAVVAPDSRRSPQGVWTWQVGDRPHDLTPDYHHALACLEELRRMPGIKLDLRRSLALGHSGGASFAPFLATNSDVFSAFAVLHGGVFEAGFGRATPRGWFSTGTQDTMRPPLVVRDALERARRAGLTQLTYREYAGGHAASERELEEVIRWWLSAN